MAEGLEMMLASYGNVRADTLYYEILDLPLEEFEKVKTVKVAPRLLHFLMLNSLLGASQETPSSRSPD